ncbi:aminotransferase class I/II-fold pyridoxal phosphate-dependent enzyme [Lysinibacter sp. HNR]|uniref:pyridoxal phosphate-dependent decarboxylase family protein n=1 Tax=Lysinibacter sp. HNR TaxID=3031408 RepID=UPI0024356E50|nr:aminotransferase class I/II-fold pyridoxal phosphate-dependent enzyme [Lysinibacter sp. HNR]WGD37435.1 aminotransferase class I/II-fold pyridoxal phosphate-dependent enzyme [Lysinibacter sp. HNR]
MHTLDPRISDAVLSHVRNRLSLNPTPLGRTGNANDITEALSDLIGPEGRDVENVLSTWATHLEPTVISCDSPRFLSFIPGAPAKTAALFDMVLSASSLHAVSWLEASGAIAAENQVLQLLATKAGLPAGAGGAFVSGGSAGNMSALAVARDTGARRRGIPHHTCRIAVSDQVHSSVANTLNLLGMTALVVPTPGYRLTADALRAALDADPNPETVVGVVATAGTTNAGIIDELDQIGLLAAEQNLWFHIDAAYGGALLLSENFRDRLTGIERADSIVIDPHKWLFTPFDCGALLYREPHLARAVHTQDESYLDVIHTGSPTEWNPSDYAYQLTRRPRGLPLWFSLSVHGTHAYSVAIERGIELAQYAAQRIRESQELELLWEPELSVVVFRRAGWNATDYNEWAQRLLQQGTAFISPSAWDGETVARLAFLHPDLSFAEVDAIIDSMLAENPRSSGASVAAS